MTEQRNISIGVGAVVFRGDDVLLIKRGKEPFLGQWSIPGGRLEYGEKLEDAVLREVMEETSLDVRLVDLLHVFEAIPTEVQATLSHTVMVDYVAEWRSGEPVAGDDAAEAEFVSLEEAEARVSWDVTRQAVKMAAAKYAAYRQRP